ncbi:MAG: flagellar basal body rod protein FlgC [Phycisphaerae bacterium]
MPIQPITNPYNLAVQGLRAEGLRMNVATQNIANANTVRTDSQEPYARKEVILESEEDGINGITIEQIVPDMRRDFKHVYNPSHPHADENGFVTMSNVEIPMELMNMMAATRAYQANVASMRRYQDMVETSLELLR